MMTLLGTPTQFPQFSVHPGPTAQLLELVRRWDVEPGSVLAPVGITEAQLVRPDVRLSIEAASAIFQRARALTGEPALGIYLGLQQRLVAYGFLGLAVITAPTLGDVLELAVKFSPTVTNHATLRLRVDGALAALLIEEHVALGEVRDMVLLNMVVAMASVSETLIGRPVQGTADFAIPEPPYFRRFAHLWDVRFSRPATQLIFPSHYLALPVVSSDKVAQGLAAAQCERTMEALGYGGSVAGLVRRAIHAPGGFLNLDEVAAALHMSPRTIKRRLAESGQSFSELLDHERHERATRLLRQKDVSLGEIAAKLGYTTPQSFARAFRRWTGTTPTEWRTEGCPVLDVRS